MSEMPLPARRPPRSPHPPRSTASPSTTTTAGCATKTPPEVIAYLDAENAYTDAVMAPTEPLQKKLYDEMLGHIKETDVSLSPTAYGGYFYYSRTEEGKQYPIHCRKQGLDATQPEAGHPRPERARRGPALHGARRLRQSATTATCSPTPPTTPASASTRCTSRTCAPAKRSPTHAERVGSVVWAADNKTLFYAVEDDDTKRQYQLYPPRPRRSRIRQTPSSTKNDERFNRRRRPDPRQEVPPARDRAATPPAKCRYLPAAEPSGAFDAHRAAPRRARVLRRPPRRPLLHPHQRHRPQLPRRHRAGQPAPAARTGRSWCRTATDVMLEDIDLFSDLRRPARARNGLPTSNRALRRAGYAGRRHARSRSPSRSTSAHREHQPRVRHHEVYRYSYQSLVTPPSVFDYDIADRRRPRCSSSRRCSAATIRTATTRPSASIATAAPTARKIPVSDRLPRDSSSATAPTRCYSTATAPTATRCPSASARNRLSLLDRGVVMAIAHIRGGGEMGKRWHDDGMLHEEEEHLHRLHRCAEYLIAQRLRRSRAASPSKAAAPAAC